MPWRATHLKTLRDLLHQASILREKTEALCQDLTHRIDRSRSLLDEHADTLPRKKKHKAPRA